MKIPERSKEVSNPYYTYGILHISDNFKDFEKSKGKHFKEYKNNLINIYAI